MPHRIHLKYIGVNYGTEILGIAHPVTEILIVVRFPVQYGIYSGVDTTVSTSRRRQTNTHSYIW